MDEPRYQPAAEAVLLANYNKVLYFSEDPLYDEAMTNDTDTLEELREAGYRVSRCNRVSTQARRSARRHETKDEDQ